jgi:hypothetical protein
MSNNDNKGSRDAMTDAEKIKQSQPNESTGFPAPPGDCGII